MTRKIKLIVSHVAKADISHHFGYYELRQKELGRHFRQLVAKELLLIQQHPFTYPAFTTVIGINIWRTSPSRCIIWQMSTK